MRSAQNYNCTGELLRGLVGVFVTGMRLGKLHEDLSQPKLTTEQKLEILFSDGQKILSSFDNGLTSLAQYDSCRTNTNRRRVNYSRRALTR